MYCWWAVDGGPGLAADPRPRHLSEGDFTGRADPARDDVHEGEQSGDRQVVRVVVVDEKNRRVLRPDLRSGLLCVGPDLIFFG